MRIWPPRRPHPCLDLSPPGCPCVPLARCSPHSSLHERRPIPPMSQSAIPTLRPSLLPPRLCLGIDIGKRTHVIGFVSADLLARHGRFDRCPTVVVHPGRAEIDHFCDELAARVPLAECAALIEHTGHYHRLLEEVLVGRGLPV